MDFVLIDASYKYDFSLSRELLSYMKQHGFKVIGLYGAVQFVGKFSVIIKQLEDSGFKVVSSKPDRTNVKFQVLGCDAFHGSLNLDESCDVFLYVGDGLFHPTALVLGQKDNYMFKNVIRYDPLSQKFFVLDISDIDVIIKKSRASLIKFLSAENIGVLVSTKPGQQHFVPGKLLKDKYSEKSFYFLLEDTFDFSKVEDFSFIDVWVNTACPRIGYDDILNFNGFLVNLNDALNAKDILSKDSFFTSRK